MGIIFECNNPRCEYHPCHVECDKAANIDGYGEASVDVPDACPYMYSDETPDFKFIPHGYAPHFDSLDDLEDWYGENYDDLPEDLRDAVDNCQFSGELAQTDYRTVFVFCGLMRSDDRDGWEVQKKVEEVCAKFKKREIFIAALYNGYRMGLLQAARLMAQKSNTARGAEDDKD